MRSLILAALGALTAAGAMAQEAATDATAEPSLVEAAGAAAEAEEALFTQAELETLVAPVALFPDTLLIQILVAATEPLEVVKADRLLLDNAGVAPEELKPIIEAEAYDASVEVLAVGFPDVIADMATHIEWTETMGDAMYAQSDDVLVAIQTMRDQAIDSGALVSGEAQTVTQDESNNVVIEPTNPEVVYVPQYDPGVVYDTSGNVNDLLAAGAITFGTFMLVDAIFDDDDPWDNYWGCRNCGGWGGGPIIRDPNVKLDVDNKVNIGDINVGNNSGNIGNNVGDRFQGGDNIDWKPDPDRKDKARDKISDRRDGEGATTLPIEKRPGSKDDLRASLSERAGAADISRPGGGGGDRPNLQRPGGGGGDGNRPNLQRPGGGGDGNRPNVQRPGGGGGDGNRPNIQRPGGGGGDGNRPNVQRPGGGGGNKAKLPEVNRPSAKPASVKRDAVAKTKPKKPAAAKPKQVKKPKAVKKPAAKPQVQRKKPTAIKKPAGGGRKASAASARGKPKIGKKRR